jgi:hypothetical protein
VRYEQQQRRCVPDHDGPAGQTASAAAGPGVRTAAEDGRRPGPCEGASSAPVLPGVLLRPGALRAYGHQQGERGGRRACQGQAPADGEGELGTGSRTTDGPYNTLRRTSTPSTTSPGSSGSHTVSRR